MRQILRGKTWGMGIALVLILASSVSAQVGAMCVPPAPGCYCDDGPNGSTNCRQYGVETSGYWLDAFAGQGAVPSLRTNLSYPSNTSPNVGQAECWDVSNTSTTQYFIPTATQSEWNSFKASAIGGSFPGLTMVQCPTCGDGVCSNAVTYWGFQESCGSNDTMTPSPETGDPMCNNDCGVCPIVCGDGFCAAGSEHCTGGAGPGYNPCVECGACSCGDAYYDCTGQCGSCASCSPCCGDGTCDGGEDGTNCAADCAAPVCGDTICNGAEDKCSCPGDCPTDVCGDGCCTGTETCGDVDSGFECNSDCGACSCTGAVPINSVPCAGDNTGLSGDTPNTSVMNCTAGTKCENRCDDFTRIVSGECRYCYEPPSDNCDGLVPACPSTPNCPADLNDGCAVLGDRCAEGLPPPTNQTAQYCRQCVFSCLGGVPSNATLCPGDGTGLPRGDEPNTLVSSCTAADKCEYTCDAGYYPSGGVCVAYMCTGSVPANSTLCAGDDTLLPANTPRTPVSACTAPIKCEYLCDPGYFSNGSACIPYVCTGPTPPFSQLCCVDYDFDTICDPDDQGLSANTPRTLVGACTEPTKCEYLCRPNYTRMGATCQPDFFCLGPDPANATMCLQDDEDLTVDTLKTPVETGACTGGTKCEFECNAGFIVDGTDCRLPMCTGVIDANATLCGGDATGLSVDTAYTTVGACTAGTKCETTCNDEYQSNGPNSCRVNVCTGVKPANSALCVGDDLNIPGNADVPLSLGSVCTGPTKCEVICTAGYELDGPGTSCVVEVFDCIGTPDVNATLCAGDDIGLLADTPVTTVVACTGPTMCEYTCNSGFYDDGANLCTANACVGAVPADADLCPGDDTNIPGNGDVTRTLGAGCSAPTFCEYTCRSGFNFNGSICVPNVCTGATPADSALCAGDDMNIPGNADVGRTLVPTCTAGTWCEYSCSDGYNYDTGVCDLNQCTGTVPSNATLCAGDDTGITGNSDVVRTAVVACTAPAFCEYTCDDGFHESGGICDVNVCTGAVPSNATLCAGDDTLISGNSNVARSVTAACTVPTKCEYTCDPGFTQDGATCRPFMCTGTPDVNATMCPADNVGLLADTPISTVVSCGVPLCEYTCNDGFHDAGANQCDPNICIGAQPSDSSICPGDGTNISGNADVSRTLVAACTAPTKCEYICDDGYNFGGATCDVNICVGAVPINSTLCAGDDTNISGNADVSRTVVAACTAPTKCEYTCDDGFNFDGMGCTNLNQCVGAVPANAAICAGDDSNIPGNSDVTRTVVPACTVPTKCEYTCDDEYHDGGGVCDVNICTGAVPTDASYCAGDDTNIPGGANLARSLVITCSATKCEYECDNGFSVDSGVCSEDGFWLQYDNPTELIPFGPNCGDAFSIYPGYTIEANAPCPSVHIGDLNDCYEAGVPGKRIKLQCHQQL